MGGVLHRHVAAGAASGHRVGPAHAGRRASGCRVDETRHQLRDNGIEIGLAETMALQCALKGKGFLKVLSEHRDLVLCE